MESSHTVLLIQSTNRVDSRSWSDFETLSDCLDSLCKMFEHFIAKKQGVTNNAEITYDLNQLFEFLDKLTDISVMVFDQQTAQYNPRNRAWVKQQLFTMIRSRCQHPEEGENIITAY